MHFPIDNSLDTRILGRIYENTTSTYKFYLFVSILDILVLEKRRKISFWELIAGMIAEAWYPIHYFRLSFGHWDTLYKSVIELQKILNIPVSYSKKNVKSVLLLHENNSNVKKIINIFTKNVPYRFLSPWIRYHSNSQVIEESKKLQNNCLYSIQGDLIEINSYWVTYLIENYTILRDYTFWGLTNFIQKRNPNVPNIPAKLQQTIQRGSLTKQRQFWNSVIEVTGNPLCIYTGKELGIGEYDLDHFVPWSFVTHNLIWNLIPTKPYANISKGNTLPSLDTYLYSFTNQHLKALKTMHYIDPNNKLLEDYLVIYSSISELCSLTTDEFFIVFQKTFYPMVQIAENMGFKYWVK